MARNACVKTATDNGVALCTGHSHNGYNLFLEGNCNRKGGRFFVAISEKQQQKGQFRIGDALSGTAWTKMYSVTDYADYYRAGSLKRISAAPPLHDTTPPPFKIDPPDLDTYSYRRARMISFSCWKSKCSYCVWANMATIEIEYDLVFPRIIDLRAFVTVLNRANFIRWANHAQYHIKAEAYLMMKVYWTTFAPRIEDIMISFSQFVLSLQIH